MPKCGPREVPNGVKLDPINAVFDPFDPVWDLPGTTFGHLGRGAETGYNGYKLYRTNCLPSDSLGLENTRNLSDFGGQSAENTRNLSDSAVSSCPMVRQCYVQLFNGWTVLYPSVQWLDSAVSSCPMVGQCCIQLSNGQTVLCPTV